MQRSLWLGYSIAPLFGPLIYAIIILFVPSITDKKDFSLEIWFMALLLYILASYIICFAIGVPLIHILKKYNKLSFLWLAIIGATLYSVTIYILLFVVLSPTIIGDLTIITVNALLIGFGLGLAIVTVFSFAAGITRHSS